MRVVVVGQDDPGGLQISVTTSLSVRRGFLGDTALAVILHLPARLFFSVRLTTRLASPNAGPDAAASPDAAILHRPLTTGFLSAVAVQAPAAWFRETLSLNVHWPAVPSASQVGHPSVHWSVAPSSLSPTPSRHSLSAARTGVPPSARASASARPRGAIQMRRWPWFIFSPLRTPMPGPLVRGYSGQSGCTVQVQLCGGTTMAGMNGVIATKPMSRMGEFGPEKTSLTAAAIEPCVPSYDCGRAGPVGAPGTVIGPSVCGFVAAMKPAPARLQPSPFWSVNEPDAPAVVGSALRISWLTRSSPSSNVDPGAHMPAGLWPSVQVVDSSGVTRRKWMPFASGLPLPTVRTIFPL